MRYSIATRIHWKLAVMRMPRTTMNVTKASQATPTPAIQCGSPATSELTCPGNTLLRSCKVYEPATIGAEAQNSTLAASWTQPENQPMYGLSVRLTHEYEAPQLGSIRLR